MGMREIGGEVGKDLIHVLGSLAPRSPEVEKNRRPAPDQVIQLRLGLDIFNRPTHSIRAKLGRRRENRRKT